MFSVQHRRDIALAPFIILFDSNNRPNQLRAVDANKRSFIVLASWLIATVKFIFGTKGQAFDTVTMCLV